MLLRVVKANHVYNFVLIPLLTFLLLLGSVLKEGNFPADNYTSNTPLLQFVYTSGIPYLGAIVINYLLVLLICFFLLQINAKFAFVKERTFLPAFLFPVIVYALPDLRVIQPAFISGIFIILSIRSIFGSFEEKSAIQNAFDAGFFVGMAGIFYFNATLFILLIPISLSIIRNKLKWRETIVPFIGVAIPWLFMFMFYFLMNKMSTFQEYIINSFTVKDKAFIFQLPVQVYFVFLLFLITLASIFILQQYGLKNISVRRFFKILFGFFILSILMIFSPTVSAEFLIFLTIPLTFLLTNYFIFMKRRFWAELLLFLLVLVSVSIQFFVHG